MGLGSCRKLIENPNLLPDFDVKKHMGQQALYCNIGIAQLEQYINDHKLYVIRELIDRLHADGLIIHINPMQEWMQKEGDRFLSPAIDTIKATIEKIHCPIIVKEVGQGMGLRSLKALFQLPLLAIEFGAFGGTNFAKLETLRNPENFTDDQLALQFIGHDAEEMLQCCNEIFDSSSLNSRFRSSRSAVRATGALERSRSTISTASRLRRSRSGRARGAHRTSPVPMRLQTRP